MYNQPNDIFIMCYCDGKISIFPCDVLIEYLTIQYQLYYSVNHIYKSVKQILCMCSTVLDWICKSLKHQIWNLFGVIRERKNLEKSTLLIKIVNWDWNANMWVELLISQNWRSFLVCSFFYTLFSALSHFFRRVDSLSLTLLHSFVPNTCYTEFCILIIIRAHFMPSTYDAFRALEICIQYKYQYSHFPENFSLFFMCVHLRTLCIRHLF